MIGDLGFHIVLGYICICYRYVYMIKYFHIVLDYVIMYYDYIGVCVIILGILVLGYCF